MRRLALIVILLAACASLPPTTIPVCSENVGCLCHAPFAAFAFESVFAWESAKLCPAKTDLTFRRCYVRAGVRDGRQVYVFVSDGGQ